MVTVQKVCEVGKEGTGNIFWAASPLFTRLQKYATCGYKAGKFLCETQQRHFGHRFRIGKKAHL
jgi:hypothetical protein